ncbi:hypothetical protein COCON_G00168420 [Conger conger]|uniref:Uncharacterized protein n=1 Tax=Conger conger TaxID=82655 RepID=A0A9Q1D869_CONCO|nr:hypothetical protein COCON_G00168420 [Conger conger]
MERAFGRARIHPMQRELPGTEVGTWICALTGALPVVFNPNKRRVLFKRRNEYHEYHKRSRDKATRSEEIPAGRRTGETVKAAVFGLDLRRRSWRGRREQRAVTDCDAPLQDLCLEAAAPRGLSDQSELPAAEAGGGAQDVSANQVLHRAGGHRALPEWDEL